MTELDEKWGLVLAGGGGKGSYEIGVMRAIREKLPNINICAISGSSVGSLNMVLYAQNNQNMAEETWKNIRNEQFLSTGLDMIDMKEGLFKRDGLLEIINEKVDLKLISENNIDMYATVSKLIDPLKDIYVPVYMRLNEKSSQEIKDILLASSALPFVYEPVIIDGVEYRDGGLADNLPVQPLYDLGIRNFIVVALSKNRKLNAERFPEAHFIYIRPVRDLGDTFTGTLDFNGKNAKYRMEMGYIDALREIEFDSCVISEEAKKDRIKNDYMKFDFENKYEKLEDKIQDSMNKIFKYI